MNEARKILIIVPAYNEGENIQRTINEIHALNLPADILVINDGSTDDTVEKAKQTSAFVVSLPFNLGIGGVVQVGFQFAVKRHYDIVVRVDGDGQHDAAFIPKLMEPIVDNQCDLVVGSRFIGPFVGYRSSLVRRLGINFFAYLISFLSHYKITDPTSGFRAYSQRTVKLFAQHYPSDYPEPEAIMTAKRCGLKITEVPVKMRKRLAGSSSIRYLKTLYYMIKVTFAILLSMIKQKRNV